MTPDHPVDAPAATGDRDLLSQLDPLDDESSSDPVAPGHVVIHYRERGIPWLLVPPLIALSGAIAVVGAYWVHKALRPPADARATATASSPAPASGASPAALTTRAPTAGSPAGEPPSAAGDSLAEPVAVAVDPFGLPIAPSAPDLPLSVLADPPAETPIMEATAPEPNPALPVAANPTDATADPSGPLGSAVGFDPALLLAPPAAGGNAADGVDGAVAATRLPGGPATSVPAEPVEPARVEPPQPAGVPVALLPRDPAEARRERIRLNAEQRQLVEQERFQFHADLRAVCQQQQGDRTAPAIQALVKAYNPVIPPQVMEQAHKALGKSGLYYRADLTQRIALLRRLGFPEARLVDAIFDYETGHLYGSGKDSTAGRDVPSKEAMYVRAARILLNNPPPRPNPPGATTPARPSAIPAAGPVR